MVIIGGMRSLLGPALGALFYILFREYLSIWTPQLAAVLRAAVRRLHRVLADRPGRRVAAHRRRRCARASSRPRRWRGARSSRGCRCPRSCAASARGDGTLLRGAGPRQGFRRHPRGRGRRASRSRDRTLHALIGPNGAGKTTVFNLISGLFAPDRGTRRCSTGGTSPDGRRTGSSRRGLARSFQITNLFPSLSDRGEPAARRAGARRRVISTAGRARASIAPVNGKTRELIRFLGLDRHRARRGRRTCPTAGSGCSTWGWRSASAPRLLLLDEPLAGLAAAERERVSQLDQADLDRTFRCCWSSTTSIACSRSPIA